jgi:gag-polypeptide of LTR copia-type
MPSSSFSDANVYRIEHLNGTDNYAVWKVRMQHIFTDLGYDDHIAENPVIPSEAKELAAWNLIDQKALSAIVLRVADNVLVYVQKAKTAKEAWTALSNMYESKGAIGITLTHRKFHCTVCTEDGSIEEHIWLMRSYKTELSRLGHEVQDDEFAYTLLESLPESWDTFVSAINEADAANSTKLIAHILAEDSRRRSHTPSDPTTALPARDLSKVKCYECGKYGHIAKHHRRHTYHEDDSSSSDSESDMPNLPSHQQSRHSWKLKSRAHVAIDDDEDFAFYCLSH